MKVKVVLYNQEIKTINAFRDEKGLYACLNEGTRDLPKLLQNGKSDSYLIKRWSTIQKEKIC